MLNVFPRSLARLLTALALMIGAGCSASPPREPVHPVKGQVFYKGKAAAGAVVWFHRIDADQTDPQNPASQTPSRGTVQADGTFEMSTYETNDGAPVGQYRVTVTWTKVTGGSDDEEDLLPARYMDPKNSGLPVVEVKMGPNEVARLDLVP